MESSYSLDDMRLFCAVARAGSFTRAARHLSIPTSTLSRRINRLEQSLGLRLLHRDAHRIALTGTGRQYLERCAPLFSELEEISGALYEEKRAARGKLRISAPINITHQWLGRALNEFLLQYPHIEIDLTLSNHNIDIDDHYIDIAFRIGDLDSSEWVARSLTEVEFILCASAKREAWCGLSHPAELENFPLVLGKPVRTWKLIEQVSGDTLSYTPGANIKLAVDDLHVASQAVVDGLGISLLPSAMVAPWLDSGAVVRVAPLWSGRPRTVHMLYRDRQNQPHRLRLLIDFMVHWFRTANDAS